jgi:nitroreductase
MELKEAIFNRRSIRAYLDKSVEREKLIAVLEAGKYAPSAMNNQARQFIAITDTAALDKINQAVYEMVDESTRARISGRSENGEFNFFYRAPVLIAVCCDENEMRPVEDCACALENMFLAAYELGLGSCWINQLTDICGNEPLKSTLEALGMKKGYRVYGCCALGYAAVEGKLSRPKTNEILIF